MDAKYLNPIKNPAQPFFRIYELHSLCETERKANAREHLHDFYTIYIITHGWVVYNTTYSEQCFAEETLLFVSPGVLHKMNILENVKGYSIIFNALFWNQINARFPFDLDELFGSDDFKTTLNLEKELFTTFLQLAETLLNEQHNQRIGQSLLLHNYLSIFLIKAFEFFKKDDEKSIIDESQHQAQVIIQFKKLIDKNFRSAHSVGMYADQLQMNPSCLNEMSKSVAGITAGELIKNKIIQEARKLLSTTDASFKEISYKLGFEDPAYFSRYFKKNTGQTMREFRIHLRELSK